MDFRNVSMDLACWSCKSNTIQINVDNEVIQKKGLDWPNIISDHETIVKSFNPPPVGKAIPPSGACIGGMGAHAPIDFRICF